MMLWKRDDAGLVQLWQSAALTVQQALRWITKWRCNQFEEAYLLHPRCCRSEQFKDIQ